MEAASLLLKAGSCEATESDSSLYTSCSTALQEQEGISRRHRQWLS
jgi:hypothetical protein